MKRFLVLFIIGLFSLLLNNFNPVLGTSSTDKSKIADETGVLDHQDADEDSEGDDDDDDDSEEDGEEADAEEGAKKEDAKEEGDDEAFALKTDSGFLFKDSDNKYYLSSRQRMWIEARDRPVGKLKGVGVQKIEVKVDEGDYYEYIGEKTHKFSVGVEGEHPITFRVTDKLNNTGDPKTFQIVVDNTPPTEQVEYQVNSPLSYYTRERVVYVPKDHKIAIFATDTGAGLRKITVSRNNGGFEDHKPGDTITLSREGLNLVKIKSVDNVLNESSEGVYNIHVDVNPPLIDITPKYALLDGDGRGVSGEDGTGTEPKDGGTGKSDPNDKGGKADKDIPLHEVGMSDPSDQDTLPGQSDDDDDDVDGDDDDDDDDSISDGKLKYTNTKNLFYLRAYDRESGVAKIEYKIDEKGDWKIYKDPVAITVPGKHVLNVRATDYVGNVKTIRLNLIVDDLAPETKIKAEKGKGAVISKDGGVVGKGVDGGTEGGKGEKHPRNEE